MSAPRRKPPQSMVERLRPSTDDLIDIGFALALCLIGVIGWRTSFSGGEELSVGMPGVVVGVLVGFLIAKLRLPLLPSIGIGLGGFFLFGGAVALREVAIGGFLPSPAVIDGLVDGSINGWLRLLTTLPPAGQAGNLLAIPYLTAFLGGSLTIVLAVQVTRWPVCALPPIGLLVITVLFGTDQPAALVLQGGVLAAVLIAWLAVRENRNRVLTIHTAPARHRAAPALAMLAVTAIGGVILGPQLPGVNDDRYVLRDEVVPPFDPQDYPSPLAGFRKFKGEDAPDDVLFEVSGLPAGASIRLAVMDDYDGLVWRVTGSGSETAGTFERVGEEIPNPADGDTERIEVTIRALDEVWLPTAGIPQMLTFASDTNDEVVDAYRFNRTTETAASPTFASEGDRYTLESVFETAPTADELNGLPLDPDVLLPDVTSIDPVIVAAAADAVGDAVSPYAQVKALEEYFQAGAYSDGGQTASPRVPAGHSLARLIAFLGGTQLVGNGEQYAATMALMALARGIPARVVLGFSPPGGGEEAVPVVGDDLHAWVEVPFQDVGWASFDPTPDEDQLPEPETQRLEEEERVETQPPPPTTPLPPPTLPDPTEQDNDEEDQDDDESSGLGLAAILRLVALVTIPLLIVLGPALAVIFWKARRRKRRRTQGPPADRVVGGWRETVDLMRDAGQPVPPRATRREVARSSALSGVGTVAERADTAIFSNEDPTEATAESLWIEVDSVREELFDPMTRGERLRARVSINSLRSQV